MTEHACNYSLLDHTADLGVIVRGGNLLNLFINAGQALISLMIVSLKAQNKVPQEPTSISVSISGHDLEDLMVRWLGEILYLFEGENLVVTEIDIPLFSNFTLHAILKIVPFNPELHRVLREIKAVTYHQIEVAPKDDYWTARVIFDL